MCIYALVFPHIFLLVDCFKWALIGDIEKWRVHSVLWQFGMWGSIISFTQVKLTFPYTFLLVDCFEWALIGHIEQQRVCSVLWQFQMGGLSVLPPRGKSENLSSNEFYALLHRRSFRITYKRPNECFPIYLLGNTINVCWNPLNRAHFSKTIDLRGHMRSFTLKLNVFPSISESPEMWVETIRTGLFFQDNRFEGSHT